MGDLNKIVVIGASEHAKVVMDVIEREAKFSILGLIDSYKLAEGMFMGYPMLGAEDALLRKWKQKEIAGGIIAIGDNWMRHRVAEKIKALAADFEFISTAHPSAQIARGVSIGRGTVIMAGAIINSESKVGDFCILNTKSSLDHDGLMEDFSSLAPGVTTGGHVHIGAFSAISLGANIIHGRTIGVHTVIGAGALVQEDIPDHCVAYGIPAKVIRQREEGEKYL
ncbi:MAG TPA: acetyltransferase [Anaerolineales bacterium]|nr:acetyltransferase [Anaerolineales bacterium]